jgi:hypothetical protein
MLPMSKPATHTWDFSDAWFLTAVGLNGRRPQSLDQIIGTADALNHAILTHAELQQAVRRLSGAALLELEPDGRFTLTAEGRALFGRRTGSFFRQTRSVLGLLGDVAHVETAWTIDPADVHKAYETYRRRTGY